MRFISLWFKYITTQLNIQCLINVRNNRKTSFVDKKWVAGAEPPTGTRGGSPSKIPLSRGKGAGG